jgi:hypothetical protein
MLPYIIGFEWESQYVILYFIAQSLEQEIRCKIGVVWTLMAGEILENTRAYARSTSSYVGPPLVL